MIQLSDCYFMDSRDDDPNIDGIRQLGGGDDGDTSVEGLVLVSSWCSNKSLLQCTDGPQKFHLSSPLISVHNNKQFYGKDKPVILHLKKDGLTLKDMPPFVQNLHPFVYAAVRQNGLALEYASAEVKNDVKIVMKSVSQNGLALKYASSNLRANTSIAIVAVTQNGQALRYVKRHLRGEKNIVLAAVLNDGLALEYASMAMRSDEEVVATAVKQNGDASRYYVGREELKRLNNKLNKDVEMAERGKKTCEC